MGFFEEDGDELEDDFFEDDSDEDEYEDEDEDLDSCLDNRPDGQHCFHYYEDGDPCCYCGAM